MVKTLREALRAVYWHNPLIRWTVDFISYATCWLALYGMYVVANP